MKIKELTQANGRAYRRYYSLITTAAVIMTAVITGSLATGDSVRNTLTNRVKARLGNTETVIFSKNSFFSEELAKALDAEGILLVNGFVSDNGRYIPVMVWGVSASSDSIVSNNAIGKVSNKAVGKIYINRTLSKELGNNAKEIVLRLPATGMVPSGSLFVTKNYTTSARMEISGVAEADDGGDLSLKNEQIIPCNVFMNRAELASLLKIEGRLNLIMSPRRLSDDDLKRVWTPATSGITVDVNNTVTSDRVFLQKEVVEEIASPAARNDEVRVRNEIASPAARNDGVRVQNEIASPAARNDVVTARNDGVTARNDVETGKEGVNRIFAYLANSLTTGADTVPYSFVAAVDSYNGKQLADDEIILSEYTAKRLYPQKHDYNKDTLTMTFYVSTDLKTLQEKAIRLRVAGVVPTAQLQGDSTLSAEFPGLSDVENCTDWDSDLPIDMSRITKEDEAYWDKYRTTPKALVSYKALAPFWSNAYGSATAVQLSSAPDLSGLTPAMTGIQLIHPREAGLNAAKNGIDFAMLFMSLGFFIIIAAVLLLLTPLSEMLFVRRNEFALLASLGYSRKRIASILRKEALKISFIASLLGVVVGALYTSLIIVLLNTLWNGAVHTGGFSLHISAVTVVSGLMTGFILTLLVLHIAIAKSVNKASKARKTKNEQSHRSKIFAFNRLIYADLYFNRKRVWISFAALTAGTLIVFATGLNRRGFNDSRRLQTATGGFSLWAETSVPVYHDLNNEEGRKKLALNDLPPDTRIVQLLKYSADDASCLNLNKVSQPTVLGIDFNELTNSRFVITNSIYTGGADVLQAAYERVGDAYPALIDETTLLWGLQRKLGDTLMYENSLGETVRLRLVGTLNNSVFQGNILLHKPLFTEIWTDITGSEVALIATEATQSDAVKSLTERALSEYGARVMTTAARLKEFDSVTDTYLTIFLVLGGLGLLLGLSCFIVVVRKDLASRAEQIALMRSLGYTDRRITGLLTIENRLVPVAAIISGFLLSLLAVIGGIKNVSLGVWLTALLFAAALIAGAWWFVKRIVQNEFENI